MDTVNTLQRHAILKVLVGSQAHGLPSPVSDQDFRGVYVIPTETIFRLDFKYPKSSWQKENGDETSWEVGEFLSLAIQSHPLILETFLAPVVTKDEWGSELLSLFRFVWTPQKAFEAFTNYAANQRTKFLEKKDERPAKYAAAYIRVLYNLCDLLGTGTFTVRIRETAIGEKMAQIKDGVYRIGEIIDLGEELTHQAAQQLPHCGQKSDFQTVERFLVRIRKAFLTNS